MGRAVVSDYTPVEQKFRIYAIYCEAQGRFVAPVDDHVKSPPLVDFEEIGEPDAYGGRLLRAKVAPFAFLACRICGAPLRRVELRREGKPS